MHGVGLFAEDLPDHAFVLIAGDGHADGGGIALGQGLDGHIVIHGLFLSQPLAGCVQKPQPLCHIVPLALQLRLTRREKGVEPFAVVVDGQDGADVGKAEAHVAQRRDAADGGQLRLAVVALVGEAVGLGGL